MQLDALILGGGIAGLWTLRLLVAAGYDAALVETRALGDGQTIASQGILHAGTKYALSGHAAEASRAAGDAAAVWRECLAGGGRGARGTDLPDLSGAAVLSRHTHMFTTPGAGSRLTGLAASKALAVGPRKLGRGELPAAFAGAPAGVDVYELDEPVLESASLIGTLAGPVRERLVLAPTVTLGHDDAGVSARLVTSEGERVLRARAAVLAAGAGNGALLAGLGLAPEIRMQRRPLHMVMARGGLPGLFAHCVSLSDKPRATITTARDRAGRSVWWIGGQIAESGVERSTEGQVAAARRELGEIVPWVDLRGAEWATWRVDRAEGFDPHGRRPDTPVVRRAGNVIACWPTKLVLAPLGAGMVLAELASLGVAPSGPAGRGDGGAIAPARPSVAAAPWDREDVAWS
ncbi:MAG TPA: FAD-dependent oxidoreductase [Phycisphaerales bacterium]|nr:FAD-dependent oxidoreductase [Phycisphaerales bacterium]